MYSVNKSYLSCHAEQSNLSMSTEYADCNDTAIARALACLYARINAQLKCKTNAKEKMCRHLLLTAASKSAHARHA